MASVDRHLREWRSAGIIDAATEERICTYEAARQQPSQERPTIVEALVYVGLAIIAVGVIVLIAANWKHFPAAIHIAIPAATGSLGVIAGIFLRRLQAASMRRGADAAWLVGGVLLVGTMAAIAKEAGWRAENAILVCGSVALPVALTLWFFSQSHAQVVGLAAACFAFSVGLGATAGDYQPVVATLSIAAFGAVGLAVTEAGILRPVFSAQALTALALAVGAYFAGLDTLHPAWNEIIVFIAAVALVLLSLNRGVFIYMVLGVAALFAGLITIVLRHISDPTLAALALILLGILMIGSVIILVQRHPWTRPPLAAH